MIQLLHICRWLKKFVIFPKQFLKLIYDDYKIIKQMRTNIKNKFILVIGRKIKNDFN